MNQYSSASKLLMWVMALVLSGFMFGCDLGGGGGGTAAGPGPGPTPTPTPTPGPPGPAGASPNLGTASTYGIFASAAAVTLAANSIVNGDVGLNPVGACTGCAVGTTIIGGVIHNGDAAAIQAQTDFGAAYVDASTRATNACAISDGELSTAQGACAGVTNGPTYAPGLYRTAAPIGVGAGLTITLDAGGNADAVFIFQTNSSITTGTTSTVRLAGLAQAKNVWWMAGSAATLGVSSDFKGTVIAVAGVTVLGGTAGDRTLVEGRLFSRGAAANVNTLAMVTVPAP